MPRPTKLTRTIQDALCWRLACGDFLTVACRSVGVAPSTVYEWLARGEGRHPTRPAAPRYVRFAEAVAPLIPEEEPDDDEFADASEQGLNSSPAPSTEPLKPSESSEVSPRAWLSQRSRRAVSIYDMEF